MGQGNFWPPRHTESTPLDRSPKNCCQWLCWRPLRPCQIWCKSVYGELLGEWVKYNEKFFLELAYRSDPSTDFHAQTTRTRARMCLLGVSLILLPILWVTYPQNPILGAWMGVFEPNVQNIESFILSKLLHRFQPNFAQRLNPPSGHLGWSQYAPNKSKMADGCH